MGMLKKVADLVEALELGDKRSADILRAGIYAVLGIFETDMDKSSDKGNSQAMADKIVKDALAKLKKNNV